MDATRNLWMTLDEAAAPATARSNEFAPGAAEWPAGLSRREFVRLAGATVAAASLTGCRLPEQKIVPYTAQPEKMIPGRPLHFATTLNVNGWARGVVVTSNEGRPTHIAGNPLHPMSLGAADVWTTASLLDLYDVDRLPGPLHAGEPVSWPEVQTQIATWTDDWARTQGEGLCLLLPPSISPTEQRLIAAMQVKYPQARFYYFDPVNGLLSADWVEAIDLTKADVIFALENNFLLDRPDSLALTRAFSRRRVSQNGSEWNRLYVAESCPTVTGAKADHRFAVAPQDFESFAAMLLAELQGASNRDDRWSWLSAVVDDLRRAGNRALILGGRSLPPRAQAALAEANDILGNAGKSRQPRTEFVVFGNSIADLAGRLERNEVRALVILGGNPVFSAPAELNFAALVRKVPLSLHLASSSNETSAACGWVINGAHDLEVWSDALASDGTLSIAQPLIAPLYGGKSVSELLALLTDGVPAEGYDLVRSTWQARANLAPDLFETQWHHWLRDGVISLSQLPVGLVPEDTNGTPPSQPASMPLPAQAAEQLWLGFRPSDTIWDGRNANNGWLQELADPLTKLTWDNAVLLSPTTAQKLGVTDADVIALRAGDVRLEAPVLITPGHADQCLTLPLGYGRTVCGSVGNKVGANAYLLRTSANPWFRPLDAVERTSTPHVFAQTQLHSRIEGRDLIHVATVEATAPTLAPDAPTPDAPSLYPPWPALGHRWAMTIDLGTCIGCNACVIACQSENNIPVVGKQQVYMGRAMQWIRVDRYYEGPAENPRVHFQPVPCMQCEDAPCEVVCPVAATQHDDEGLNVMVYNRCVGTRYCSNNCPYKVRRFNFLFYNADIPATQRLRLNPNVTVRSRGVMEKCTYCVQRIEEARIAAERETRPLRGEDIVTACQAACPAESIAFGDLSDPQSIVSKNRRLPGHYALLGELNTKPRTTYLEKRFNPNPALAEPADRPPASI